MNRLLFATSLRSWLSGLCLAALATLATSPAQAARPMLHDQSEISLQAAPLKSWNAFRTSGAIHEFKTHLPLANYVAEMWVTPGAKGGSVVHWRASFQRPEEDAKPGQDDEATMKLVQGIFKASLDNIAAITSK